MKKRLEDLLLPLDNSPVECDGMSSLVATILFRNGVSYQGMCGQIIPRSLGRPIPHVWIEVGDLVVDMRARMWLGDDPSIPHGVFKKSDFESLYHGEAIHIEPLPEVLFSVLQVPFPKELLQQKGSDLEP